MPVFQYKAKNEKGKTIRGKQEAASEKALQQWLRDQGLYLLEVKDGEQKKRRKPLSVKQLAEFNRELSSLLGAGVSLVRALDIIAEDEATKADIRAIYRAISTEIKRGVSLSVAMETTGCFPELMLGMVRSGEGIGNLDEVTNRLAIQYEKDHRLTGQVKSAMVYPMILIGLCIAIVILMMTVILPQFSELFAGLPELPLPTRILMAFSDLLINYWFGILIGLFILVVLCRTLLYVEPIRLQVNQWKVHIPIAGKLNQTICTARFCRTLSSLYCSGVPVVSALKTATDTIGNYYIEHQFDSVLVKVRSGVPMSQALREVDGLKKKLSGTIYVGEESGQLDVMLNSIAETMEEEAQEATKRLVTLIEPIMIIIIAVIVAFIIVAVMLPIYQSYGTIG